MKARRSRLKPFVTLAKTIRRHRDGGAPGSNNARHEALNRRVRLIVNRAYGFHSAPAALAPVMPVVGPLRTVLLHERTPAPERSLNGPHRCWEVHAKSPLRAVHVRPALPFVGTTLLHVGPKTHSPVRCA
ncbi:MAG: transposase [Acidimicrobiales bacterium]